MAARGYAPRSLREARPVATAAGALFIRSYERAERVHAAMLGRGFTGVMPHLDEAPAGPGEWLIAAWAPALAAAAAVVAAVMS
jgi:cobalt/nickel transport system permease protein